jgi:putative ABC transport system permease protein
MITAIAPLKPTTVLSRSNYRHRLEAGGVNNLLSFGFGAGVAGGTLLALLAIAFAVLAGASGRVRLLGRLRILGLSRRQWRGLLAYELGPPMGVALGIGALVGAALPVLLAPVLELSTFADGAPVGVRVDVRVVGAVLALAALGLITAIVVEAIVNRRPRLAEALEPGEGS